MTTTTLRLVAPSELQVPAMHTRFPSVLLGIDFGSPSLAAARWATSHVALQSHAILSHVVGCPPEDDEGGNAGAESHRRLAPALMGGLGGFAATLDVASARTTVRFGSPSYWLSTIANGAEASLVVLGRRADANRTGVGEPNVIERLARRVSASVLVVPEGAEPPRHILAAVDNSEAAPRVLAAARWLARMHEIPLTVLHVFWPVAGAYDRVIRKARRMAARPTPDGPPAITLDEAPAPAPMAGPRAPAWLHALTPAARAECVEGLELVAGDPAREVNVAALARPGSLVVAGMRGADGAPIGSIGSVARELLTRAPVPVLVVNGGSIRIT